MDRSETLDTLHAGILFVGVVVLVNITVSEEVAILQILSVLLVWVLGYWGFVKFILPPSLSGQKS